jgi:hypothetical protein
VIREKRRQELVNQLKLMARASRSVEHPIRFDSIRGCHKELVA